MTAVVTPSPSKGATISIGTTATDASGDTFSEIGMVTDISEFGPENTDVKFMPLKGTGEETVLGGFKIGNISVTCGKDLRDSGQAAVKTARGVNSYYNFKITANDAKASGSPAPTPSNQAFKAKVVSAKTNYGNEGQVIGITFVLAPQASSYVDTVASA